MGGLGTFWRSVIGAVAAAFVIGIGGIVFTAFQGHATKAELHATETALLELGTVSERGDRRIQKRLEDQISQSQSEWREQAVYRERQAVFRGRVLQKLGLDPAIEE